MKLSDLTKKHPEINELIKRIGDVKLFPPQEEALKSGFLNKKNLLLASPTSSGKTLIALIASLINHRKGKTVYLVPLKSLAVEKYNDFKEKMEGLMSIGLSIGDLTRSDERLKDNDLIICSYEKYDSLMRHKASWIREVTLTIFDEVHLIDDLNRGPIIEVLMTRLKEAGQWIIGLSATIGNPEEFGKWFNAIIIKSNFRPVKLYEGLLFDNEVRFKNKELIISDASMKSICVNALRNDKQVIIFVNTRRSAESVAEKLSKELKLNNETLNEVSSHVLNALPSPTRQCKRLSECVKNGVAFDHAGLISEQKHLIESGFRQGIIKVITATTVLAYGVSLPAHTVIIRDFKRFTSNGITPISVSEYLQIAGRAGRSGYDKEGYSILIVGSEAEKELAWNNYLKAQPQELISKLGVEWVLRFHALSLICDGTCNTELKITEFFNKTFFGQTYGEELYLKERIEDVITELIDWGFIKEVNNKLAPSEMGLRINELYIDPLSAKKLINGLNNYKLNPLGFIHLACTCSEIQTIRLKQKDYQQILEELAINEELLFNKTPSPFSSDYEYHLRALKTALIINDWINELSEDEIMSKHGLAPGSLHQLLRNIEWVLHSTGVIAETMNIKGVKEYINGLIIRVKYGVKSDLLTLVSLKGVGRVRARKLYTNNIRTVSDLRRTGLEKLKRMIGERTASKLIKQLDKELD